MNVERLLSQPPEKGRPPADDRIRIAAYEDAMRSRVSTLLCEEYGGLPEDWEASFVRFYDHPFQRGRSIRIVALDQERIVGLMTFFYWPYRFGSERLASFQAGNAIVASAYRGRGVFARLLAHLDAMKEKERISFLTGFPVAKAFGSYLRNGWTNPLDLSWYARLINPLSVFSSIELASVETRFEKAPEPIGAYHAENVYLLAAGREFADWRRQIREETLYRYFHHSSSLGRIRFDLKLNRRGQITELIIGGIAATDPDPALLASGMQALVRATRGHRFITILTIALNRQFRVDALTACLRQQLFFRLRPKIHFIVKDMQGHHRDVADPARWRLLRGDLDTW